MNIKPLGNNVLIQPLQPEVKTTSGIILPDSAKNKPEIGKILAIGPNITFVKEGDNVLWKKWGGNDLDKDQGMVISEEDILAIVEE